MEGLEDVINWSDYLNGDFDHIEPLLAQQGEHSVDFDESFSLPSHAAQDQFPTPMALSETAFPVNDSSIGNIVSFQNVSSHEPANLEVFSSANGK
jgi:hypothetical protein